MEILTYRRDGNDIIPSELVDKKTAHTAGLLHRSVHLLIRDAASGIFVRKRKESEFRYAGLYTSSIGTHVEVFDDYLDTLKKHYCSNMHLMYAGEFRVHDDFENEVCGLFITDDTNFDDEFSQDRLWLTESELSLAIQKGLTTPHLERAYSLFRERFGND